jgi:hypothetical protein
LSGVRDPLRDVVRALAGPELDDAKVRQAVLVERVLADDVPVARGAGSYSLLFRTDGHRRRNKAL